MGRKAELPVFTQTNLGTRIAITVSPEITARDFKGELERAHIDCFPEVGFISIDEVMVKCNSNFYHVPALLPLKHVFKGFQGSWVVHVNASISKNIKSNKLDKPELVVTADPIRKRRKRKSRKRKRKPVVKKLPGIFKHENFEPRGNISIAYERDNNDQQEGLHASKVSDSHITAESPRGSLSKAVSVSGIINRYFRNSINLDHVGRSSSSEVSTRTGQYDVEKVPFCKNSSNKRNSVNPQHRVLPSLLPVDSNSVALTNKYERYEIGRRVLAASNNVRSSQRSNLPKSKKFWDTDARLIARSLVYEIENND